MRPEFPQRRAGAGALLATLPGRAGAGPTGTL